MKALIFQIRTLQPLLITRPGAGEENSAISYDYIPGSVLRGLLISRYMQKNSLADAAGDPICRRLFFDGSIVYLNAYPTHRLGGRTLPKPFSWMADKEGQAANDDIIYDFAIQPKEDEDGLAELKGAFCWLVQGDEDELKMEIYDTLKDVGMHNASEDRNVKRKGDSTVFRYEAIATSQSFSGAILSDNICDLQALIDLLAERTEAHIGGSRSAGYGLIRFEQMQINEEWCEYNCGAKPEEGIVIITLLSDAILRNTQTGGFTTNLSAVLGLKHLRAFTRTRVVGGFNRKWGLPLIQATALQAGSTFVYDSSKAALSRQIEQIVKNGVGERRVEGFGRLACNWHTKAELIRRTILPKDTIPEVSLSEPSKLLAKQMAERRLRRLLESKLMKALATISISGLENISTAQLSKLRQVNLCVWQEYSFKRMETYLEKLKKPARTQLAYARINNKPLNKWLTEAIADRIWLDHLQPQHEEIPSVAGIKAEITKQIIVEYTARLLDALLQRTIKEIQQIRNNQRVEGGEA